MMLGETTKRPPMQQNVGKLDGDDDGDLGAVTKMRVLNPINPDYDLSNPIPSGAIGMRQSLTSYGDAHFSLFLRKVFIKALGYSEDALSRPIIGIVNTYSSFNPCHANVPQLIEAVKRGVQLNGGLAIDFPTISIHESFSSPTSMYLRNLMSVDTEEMIRAQPCDAVVLIGGCDKTTPAQLMGGLSANKSILHLVTGPMMPGSHKGVRIGACTDCWSNWASYRAGKMDIEDIVAINEELAPTAGTCGVMGTASTMACILVALGLMPFGGASAPAVSATRLRIAEKTGSNAILLTKQSFLNALTVLQAIGGSTNAVVHLMAIVGRHEDPEVSRGITLDTVDNIGRKTPLLVDLKPSGDNYMTDFHNSGGMRALLEELRPLLYLDAMTMAGKTLGEELDRTPLMLIPRELCCIQPFNNPLYPASSLVILRGNLAPGGAVIKASASKRRSLLNHSGVAVVFSSPADMAQRLDDPDLEVTEDSVLILRNIGPAGNPGMPEAGMIPIPRKLSSKGVLDMLRLSDGRMSGTAGGSIVLHISPEAADPRSILGIVQGGDVITCSVEKRILRVELSDKKIHKSAEGQAENAWSMRQKMRGYKGLFMRTVMQAERGADFDFLSAEGPGNLSRN
ncbi:dihydroxy-acid/6-phosphogluconate dehydratase [Bisporella sp. PMI_857]|nr:dihydroxy-acid/6-phosphogluconate dehydratase [Bisporella sp. PMI_857]